MTTTNAVISMTASMRLSRVMRSPSKSLNHTSRLSAATKSARGPTVLR